MKGKLAKKRESCFFEQQREYDDTCRLHAINNVLGKSLLSRQRFLNYCDEFDQVNHCQGSRKFFFIESNNNIISFVLHKFGLHTTYYSLEELHNLRNVSLDDVSAVMMFDEDHIWCVKKVNGTWFKLDSSSTKAVEISSRTILSGRGYSRIVVWNSSRPTEENEATEKQEEKKKKETTTNQRVQIRSKRSLRRKDSHDELLSDESEIVVSHERNRFDELSDDL